MAGWIKWFMEPEFPEQVDSSHMEFLRAYTKHTQEVYPNDLKALEQKLFFNKFRGGTAAVILLSPWDQKVVHVLFQKIIMKVFENYVINMGHCSFLMRW